MAFDPLRIPMTFVMSRGRTASPGTPRARIVNAIAAANLRIYRLTGGRVAGHLANARLLLLHHRGRKTGIDRVTPLVFVEDGKNLVIAASLGGAPKSPVWFTNLMANPDTEVEVGRELRQVRARRATTEEAERLWPRLDAAYPPFAGYRERARGKREIPVVILEPRS